MKRLTIVVFTAVLFAGCMMEKPTARNYRKVLQMEELTPITVAQLKQMIAADTTHYKVVVLTSSCCGPCHISMRDVYPRKMAECDSNRVRWYFIEERYSTAQYMDKVFANYHIDAPRYWINDTLPQYRPLMVKKMRTLLWNVMRHRGASYEELGWDVADNRMNNIVNDIAPQAQTITGPNGTPTTMLLDPQNRMKCTYVVDANGNATFEPADIRDVTVPVTDLDYTVVDTLRYVPQVCTPDGRCE